MRCLIVFVITLLHHQWTAQAYKAAVVEYYPEKSDTPKNTIRKNLDEYKRQMDSARSQSSHIIVFPEYGLTTLVDDPTDYAIDITDEDEIMKEITSMVKERNMYTVINLIERAKEPNKETKYYNTNLVFARNGTIIAKYRKINLFKEPKLTRGADDQDVYFKTDSGVTFGIFTGADILQKNPSRTVLKHSEVTDVIYTSAWVSTLPFYSSLSVEHGYSLANGVNLLAANYGKPKESHGGSGIYLASGAILETYIADTPSTKLIVQDVSTRDSRQDKTKCPTVSPQGLPGDVAKSNVTNYVTQKDFHASDYKFQKIDFTQEKATTEVCDGSFCCTFDITLNTTLTFSTVYKVMAFDGTVDFGESKAHIRVCSLLACSSDSDDSCGERVDTSTVFTKITVKGNVEKDDSTYYMPLTLDKYLLPLRQTVYCDTNNATNSTFVQLTTLKRQEGVLVFGIFGKTGYTGGSVAVYGTVWLLVLGVVKNLLF